MRLELFVLLLWCVWYGVMNQPAVARASKLGKREDAQLLAGWNLFSYSIYLVLSPIQRHEGDSMAIS